MSDGDIVLRENLHNLAIAVGDEATKLRVLINNNKGSLADLTTSNKTNLVAAINELKAAIGEGVVALLDDGPAKPNKTWSSSKVAAELEDAVDDALAEIRAGVPTGLDTLQKIAQSLGNQTNLIGFITSGLNNRVRVDTATQNLSLAQRSNARKNIDAASTADVGADIDLVAVFRTGLRTDLL